MYDNEILFPHNEFSFRLSSLLLVFLLLQFSEHLAVGGTVLHRELTDQFAEGINLYTLMNISLSSMYISLLKTDTFTLIFKADIPARYIQCGYSYMIIIHVAWHTMLHVLLL